MADITTELAGLTDRVLAYRIARIINRGTNMPLIEIKGLGTAVAGAKKGISDLRQAAAGLNTETTALNLEIVDLTEQVKQHRKDLRFEAETLGNGAPTDEPEKPLPPVASPEGQQTGALPPPIIGDQRKFDRMGG